MDSISLTARKRLIPSEFASELKQQWKVELTEGDGLVVHGASSRVYLVVESTRGEQGLFQMFLNYSSVELVKEVLERIADDPDITVDNDFGTALPGNKFVERIRTDPSWNWRD
jgi:hypothetical protein